MTYQEERMRLNQEDDRYKKAYKVPPSPAEKRKLTELTINTRVPEKYLIVDRETGDVWQWGPGNWWRQCNDLLEKTFDFKTITVKATAMKPKREKK